MKLPDIIGKNKAEIETAKSLRTKALQLFERSFDLAATHPVIKKNITRVGKKMIQQTKASWWIERRDKIFTTNWPFTTVVKLGQDLGVIRKDDKYGW